MSAARDTPAIEQEPLRRIEIAGGLEFHYVERGEGTPLVFVHGVLGDWRTWAPQWEAFTPQFRAISYSRRYNAPNRNRQPSPDHSARVEAEDLGVLLNAWQASPAFLVATSYGAFAALALAIAQPDKVRALVLAEPPMLRWADLSAEGRQARAAFDREIRLPAREAFLRGEDAHAVQLLTGGIAGARAAAGFSDEAMRRRQENALAIRTLTLSSDEFPWLTPQEVASVQAPTLLLAGEQTPAIHDTVFRNLCAVMCQAEVRRIPQAGHGAARDNPVAFNQAALEFLLRHR